MQRGSRNKRPQHFYIRNVPSLILHQNTCARVESSVSAGRGPTWSIYIYTYNFDRYQSARSSQLRLIKFISTASTASRTPDPFRHSDASLVLLCFRISQINVIRGEPTGFRYFSMQPLLSPQHVRNVVESIHGVFAMLVPMPMPHISR